jgi:Transposase IS66 family
VLGTTEKKGVCTVIGSPLFTYFESTFSKSRINFLEVLRGCHTDYRLTTEALNYAFDRGLHDDVQVKLESHIGRVFRNRKIWENFLKKQSIAAVNSVRIVTESALLGSIISHGFPADMHILSDAAPQFCLLYNALCWIHEERHYCKLTPCSEMEKVEIEKVRDEIWKLYWSLKKFKQSPTTLGQVTLENRFDEIFGKKYQSEALNSLLKNTRSRKEGLLRVLSYPAVSLDNNGAERDIREYVKRRKISGSTRSEAGRRARDTFASLKKTCGKLCIRFWDYLLDRLTGTAKVPMLGELIGQRSREGPMSASLS